MPYTSIESSKNWSCLPYESFGRISSANVVGVFDMSLPFGLVCNYLEIAGGPQDEITMPSDVWDSRQG
jgi:hypothetical protein